MPGAIITPHTKETIKALTQEAAAQVQAQLPKGLHCVVMVVSSADNEWCYRSFWPPGLFLAVLKMIVKKGKEVLA